LQPAALCRKRIGGKARQVPPMWRAGFRACQPGDHRFCAREDAILIRRHFGANDERTSGDSVQSGTGQLRDRGRAGPGRHGRGLSRPANRSEPPPTPSLSRL
jgi:hypothetical protein